MHRILACLFLFFFIITPSSIFAAAGLPSIDSQDPHRFLLNGQPWYFAGYYPAIGTLSGTDDVNFNFTTYYKSLIDKQSANGINYFRSVFNMGQPINNAKNVYQRTGPGTANDGRPKFDLTKFDQSHFDYYRQIIQYAQSKNVVVQLVLFDNWHNKNYLTEDGGSVTQEWGMKHDYYFGINNINGINTADVNQWTSTSHPVYQYQQALIRKVVDSFSDLPNIIYEISNENYYSSSWELALTNYLTNYESQQGKSKHLVMPRDLPNHDSAGGKQMDPIRTHNEIINNYSKNQPLITDNDGGGSASPEGRRKKAWATLTGGGHMDYFHPQIRDVTVLNSQDTTDGMRYLGYLPRFITNLNINLRGMRPNDGLVSNGWAYAASGDRYLIYLISGGSTTVSNLPSSYSSYWLNPRNGTHQIASGGPTFSAPDSNDWALYIVKSSGSPTATPTPISSQFVLKYQVFDSLNSADWHLSKTFNVDDLHYADRPFTLTRIPAELDGAEWLSSANDSKNVSNNPLVIVTLKALSRVYLVIDPRVAPSWLTGWTKTNLIVTDSQPHTFNVYYKDLQAETLSVGPQQQTESSMYALVFTAPPAATATPVPKTGDLDLDGDVDIFDYNLLVGKFGQTDCAVNITGSCVIDIFDYNLLVQNFGQ